MLGAFGLQAAGQKTSKNRPTVSQGYARTGRVTPVTRPVTRPVTQTASVEKSSSCARRLAHCCAVSALRRSSWQKKPALSWQGDGKGWQGYVGTNYKQIPCMLVGSYQGIPVISRIGAAPIPDAVLRVLPEELHDGHGGPEAGATDRLVRSPPVKVQSTIFKKV